MNKDELYFYNRGFNDCLAKGLNPVKELTDEEIYAEMVKCIDSPNDGHEFRYKDFARAILRKAQEK